MGDRTLSDPGVDDASMSPAPWVVRRALRETHEVVTLELEARDRRARTPPAPGQFFMLYVFGVGEVPISVSRIGPAHRIRQTIRDVGAVTHALCQLRAGDVVGLRGPFGSAWPIADAAGGDLVVVAGGIGIAPLRPVLEAARADRERYRDVVLLYGARQPEDLLYADEFEAARAAGIQVEVTVDHADQGWPGHVGVVTTLIRHAGFEPASVSAFVCGPEVMMWFMARELVCRGVAPERIHLSMERNMKCAIGMCGHCQLGPEFVCLDGPVFPWPRLEPLMAVPEL